MPSQSSAFLTRYRKKLQALEDRLSFPRVLNVESTNYCNLECPMCARTTSMTRAQQHMDLALFQKIADEAGLHGVHIMWLHFFGEPLMHPQIIDFIRYAKRFPKIENVALSTNGTVLSEKRAQQLMDSGIDVVLLAIDAATEGTYKIVRSGYSFDKTVANCERFLEMHLDQDSKIRVDISIIEMSLNRNELEAFEAKWTRFERPGRIRIIKKTMINFAGQVDTVPLGSAPRSRDQIVPCRKIWNSLSIHSDGRVVACCYDVNGHLEYGRIPDRTLKSIWDGPELARLREQHWNLNIGDLPLCKGCDAMVKSEGTPGPESSARME